MPRQPTTRRRERWLSAAGDLLLGAACPGCARPGLGLCHACRQRVEGHVCRLTRPDPCPARFPCTAAAGPYDAVLQQLISAHKEHQTLTLTPLLGDRLALSIALLLAETGAEVGRSPLLLVPMPSAPGAIRERGFDATTALARRAARRLREAGLPRVGVARMLRQARAVDDQAGLSAVDRQRNLAGALTLRRSSTVVSTVVSGLVSGLVSGRGSEIGRVVIIDDVVTTGASLSEANRVLGLAAVPVLGAAVVAATQRHRVLAAEVSTRDAGPERAIGPSARDRPTPLI